MKLLLLVVLLFPISGQCAIAVTQPSEVMAVYAKNTPSPAPADTAENTLITHTLSAGSIGPNDLIEFLFIVSYTNNANVKTFRVKIGATIFASIPYAGGPSAQNIIYVRMRNSLNSQVSWNATNPGDTGTSGAAVLVSSEDLSVSKNITVTMTKAVAGDTFTVESFIVRVWKPRAVN